MQSNTAEKFVVIENNAPAPVRAPGRPRSEASRTAILDSTRRLMTHMSVRDLSIEAIAKKAGVGKTTIYRWWPNKVAVVIEAFADQLDMHSLSSGNETASENMIRMIERLMRQLRGKNGKIIADILAEAQSDAKVLAQFNEFYMDSRRNSLYQTILRGQQDGDFNPNIDPVIAIDLILGPIFMRLMNGEAALDDQFTSAFPMIATEILRA